jgi:hypothetical protein
MGQQTENEWIEHDGHICPVCVDTLVMYKVRSGWTSDGPVKAGLLRWDKGRCLEAAADRSHGVGLSDIVAFRIVESAGLYEVLNRIVENPEARIGGHIRAEAIAALREARSEQPK